MKKVFPRRVLLALCRECVYNKGEREIEVIHLPVWSGILFEWDEEKAAANLRKHKLSFDEAMHVFDDNNRIEYYDALHSDQEDRFYTIGMVRDIIFVVYTERREAIRIISARKANEKEVRLYYDG